MKPKQHNRVEPVDVHAELARALFGEVNADTRARAKIINYSKLWGKPVKGGK